MTRNRGNPRRRDRARRGPSLVALVAAFFITQITAQDFREQTVVFGAHGRGESVPARAAMQRTPRFLFRCHDFSTATLAMLTTSPNKMAMKEKISATW